MSYQNDPGWWAVERQAHVITFSEHEGLWRAHCSCGWRSRAREKETWVGYEADQHLAETRAECDRQEKILR